MGHVTRYGIKVDTSDFRQVWHGTVAYNVDYDYRDYDPLEHGGFCI